MLSKAYPPRALPTGAPFRPRSTASQAAPERQRGAWTAFFAAPALALVGGILLAGTAQAAPPPVGSDDWQIMHPYAEWVTSQHDRRGYWCCDIGDGRPVEARIVDDHWEVHITKVHFPDEPEHWLAVPDGKITAGGNPNRLAAARQRAVLCPARRRLTGPALSSWFAEPATARGIDTQACCGPIAPRRGRP